MPGWSKAYKASVEARFTESVKGLDQLASDIVEGRVTPRVEDIPIGSARRVRAAVLFLDIVGFTKRANRSDNETLRKTLLTLDCFIPAAMRAVFDEGGYVEKNTGDGLMGVFGVEGTDADASIASLRAALTIKWSVAHLVNPYLAKRSIAPLQFRIGIDLGTFLLARIGVATGSAKLDRNFLTAVGPTANIASKIEGIAPPDQILVGENVRASAPAGWQSLFKKRPPIADWIWTMNGRVYDVWLFNGVWTDPKV
jgi:class 3 adenylate cyclase